MPIFTGRARLVTQGEFTPTLMEKTLRPPIDLAQLNAAAPALLPGDELILLPDPNEPVALLRHAGAPPTAFAFRDGVPVPLDPAADAKIPGAALLADPMELRQRLRPFIEGATDVRVVAWRPGKRVVVRLTDAEGKVHWLKLLTARGYLKAEATHAAIEEVPAPVKLLLPAHLLPDISGFLMPSAAGTSLNALLTADQPPPIGLLADAVCALATTKVRSGLPVYSFEHARAATIAMLEKAGGFEPECLKLIEPVHDVVAPAPLPVLAFVHGDLHDKQIFFAEDSASVIDLESMGVGDARFDVLNLIEHLRLRDLQQLGTESGVSEMVLSELGFDAGARGTQVFRAVVRARLAGVYALRPRWAGLAAQLRTEARALLRSVR